MSKYKTVWCEGYWSDDPENIMDVKIALGSWDEVEDLEDETIFFYMDDEPLTEGLIIGDDFTVTNILFEDII
jgi:hypothetical protein